MDHKKPVLQVCWKLIALATVLSAVGCASNNVGTNTVMLSANELNQYEANCRYKSAQLEFLQRQVPSQQELYNNRLAIVSSFGAAGSDRVMMDQGWNKAIAIRKMEYLKTWCQ
jgi:hypothetical protein